MPTLNPKKPNQKLLERTLKFLGVRARSRHEIVVYLERFTLDREVIDTVLSELESFALIDDQKFAIWYIESRLHQKPRGSYLIRLELVKRYHLDSEIVKHCLSRIPSADWNQAALKILDKYRHKLLRLDVFPRKLKARQILFSKGFPEEIATSAIDEFSLGE
ncbi:MAG: Recombination regulator RecX [uncultured bacterium]|nr:MAG: Recombination regulator RecX [uncultured bacterium]